MKMAFASSAWRHEERLPLEPAVAAGARQPRDTRDGCDRNSHTAPGSTSGIRMNAYSWHGKKIRILHGPGVGPAKLAVTNRRSAGVSSAPMKGKQTVGENKYGKPRADAKADALSKGMMSRSANSERTESDEKENASKVISKAWRESKMARTRKMLEINHSTTSGTSSDCPPLLPSPDPVIPPASTSIRSGGAVNKKGKRRHKKKKSISFSLDANETRTFERVEDGDVSSVWYSKEEEMANRLAASNDDTPISRLGLADTGTQTMDFGFHNFASHGSEYRRRHAEWQEKSKTKGGRRTTTAVGWRKGAKYGKVVMEKALVFPGDMVGERLKKERRHRLDRAGGRW